MLKEHKYYYDSIVIGGNLNAIVHAYKTNSFFIHNHLGCIFPYDTISDALCLDEVRFDVGTSELEVYERLSHEMSMQARDILGRQNQAIHVYPELNQLSVSSNFFRPKNFRYKHLTIFDTESVYGLPFEEPRILGYRVFDWFNVRSGTVHKHNLLTTDSNFVKKIHFYLSPRIDGNKNKKDLVAESFLTVDQVNDIHYSDSIVRLKTLNTMKENGILGTSNGQGKNLSLKIEMTKREKFAIKEYKSASEDNITLESRHYSEV